MLMEGEPKPKRGISSLTMADGVEFQSLDLSLAVLSIKVSHFSKSAGTQGVTVKA